MLLHFDGQSNQCQQHLCEDKDNHDRLICRHRTPPFRPFVIPILIGTTPFCSGRATVLLVRNYIIQLS